MPRHVRVTPLEKLDAIAFRHGTTAVTFIAPEVPEWCRLAVVEHLSMCVRVADEPCASAWLAIGQAVELATEPVPSRRTWLSRIPVPSRPVIAAALAALVSAPAVGLATVAWQSTPEHAPPAAVWEQPRDRTPATVPQPSPPQPIPTIVVPPPLPPTPSPPATAPAPTVPTPSTPAAPTPPLETSEVPTEPRVIEITPNQITVKPRQLPVVGEVLDEVVDSAPVADVIDLGEDVTVPLPFSG